MAPPRLSAAHIHPGPDWETSSGDEDGGGGVDGRGDGGSRYGSLLGGARGYGSGGDVHNNSFLINSNSRHGVGVHDGGNDSEDDGRISSIRSASGAALNIGQATAIAAAAVGAAEIEDFVGAGAGAGGGAAGGAPPSSYQNSSRRGPHSSFTGYEYPDNSPVASPCDSFASSFFSVSSPRRMTVAADGRWRSGIDATAAAGGVGIPASGGMSNSGFSSRGFGRGGGGRTGVADSSPPALPGSAATALAPAAAAPKGGGGTASSAQKAQHKQEQGQQRRVQGRGRGRAGGEAGVSKVRVDST